MRGIFQTIYGSIVVNHASLPVKDEEFNVKVATRLEKTIGVIYKTLSRKAVNICAKKNWSKVQQHPIDLGVSGQIDERVSHLQDELLKYYHELWMAMLQTTADKFKYVLYCSSSAKLVQSHIVKTSIVTRWGRLLLPLVPMNQVHFLCKTLRSLPVPWRSPGSRLL